MTGIIVAKKQRNTLTPFKSELRSPHIGFSPLAANYHTNNEENRSRTVGAPFESSFVRATPFFNNRSFSRHCSARLSTVKVLAAHALFSITSQTFIASHAGVFRGARISPPPPPPKAWATENRHSFPKCTQSHCTFQSLEGWTWLQGNPIINRSARNTGKALWPLINVRLRAEKVRFSQILEYSVYCINLSEGKKRRKKVTLGSRVYTIPSLWVVFSLSTLYLKTVDWSLTTRIKQRERNVVLGWAGVCGEGRNTSSPKNACVGGYEGLGCNWK